MTIILVGILMLVLHLIIWESIVLGIAWMVGAIAGISINFLLIGGIVFAIWVIVALIYGLVMYNAYKVQKEFDRKFDL